MTTTATRHHHGYFGQLNYEWDTSLKHQSVLARDAFPHLEAFSTAEDVVNALASSDGDRTISDPILHSLIDAGQHGDRQAQRIVLQAMLGLCVKMAYRHLNDELKTLDHEHEAVAIMWELIVTYPLHNRPRAIAGNLKCDILKAVTRMLMKARRFRSVACQPGALPSVEDSIVEGWEDSPTREIIDLLTWAQRTSAITPTDSQIIALRHLDDVELSFAQIGERLGISAGTANRRYGRAITKLTQAASDYLA
ncbi:RNA polymerase sigma factor [Dermacoccus abyssi]